MKEPDATADLVLLSSDAGGRAGPTPEGRFGCIMVLPGINLDVRMQFDGQLHPGRAHRVKMSFLSPDLAAEHLRVGTRFRLRESQEIGSGAITALHLAGATL